MRKIRNSEALLSAGDIASRQVVLDIANRTLDGLDSYRRMRAIMCLEGDILHIGTRSWGPAQKASCLSLCAGKACNHMAMAVDHVLADRLTSAIAIVKTHEETDRFNKTKVFVGGAIRCRMKKVTAPPARSSKLSISQVRTISSSS